MKSNGTDVTNNLFQFQTINYIIFLSKLSPSSLMLFPILLYNASMNCWKDYSGMQLSPNSPFDGLHIFKTDPLNDTLKLGEKKKV